MNLFYFFLGNALNYKTHLHAFKWHKGAAWTALHPSFKYKFWWFFVKEWLIFTWWNRTMRDICHLYYFLLFIIFWSPTLITTCPLKNKGKNICFHLSSLSSFYSYPFTLKFLLLKLANNHYFKLLNFTFFLPLILRNLIMK